MEIFNFFYDFGAFGNKITLLNEKQHRFSNRTEEQFREIYIIAFLYFEIVFFAIFKMNTRAQKRLRDYFIGEEGYLDNEENADSQENDDNQRNVEGIFI